MKRTFLLTALAAFLFTLSSNSQTPQRAGGPNPGVSPTRMMDNSDVRVTRVELQPNAVRSVHTHNDVRFHLFIPVNGQVELTIGSAAPVVVAPGQVISIERGVPHGFRNIGNSPAMVMEVFAKDGSSASSSK